jgi:glutamate-1-semialdehyde 2,1-aminomutase
MAAGLTQLTILKDHPEIYKNLNAMGDQFYGKAKQLAEMSGLPLQFNHVGSLGCLFFTDTPVVNYATAKTADTSRYATYFTAMLEQGIYLAPAQFEAMFLSAAHTEEELNFALECMNTALK